MKSSLFRSLWSLHLITPRGFIRLLRCFLHEGITMMAAVRFAARYHAHECAVVSDNQRIDYQDFYAFAKKLSYVLYHEYQLRSGQHVALFLSQPSCFGFASSSSFTFRSKRKITEYRPFKRTIIAINESSICAFYLR